MTVVQGNGDAGVSVNIQCLLADLDLQSLVANFEAVAAPAPSMAAPVSALPPVDGQEGLERRTAHRMSREELVVDFRLTIPGASDVIMINVSETGALIETTRRMSPGTAADIFVRLNGQRHAMRARTVRSTLHAINSTSGVVYRTALHFDKRLPLAH